jgi:hypothetical protein
MNIWRPLITVSAHDRLKPLFIDESPGGNPLRIPEKIQWVQPILVCEVAFAERTEDASISEYIAFLS